MLIDMQFLEKEAEKYSRVQRLQNRNSAHVECDSKSDTGNNRVDWNHFKITQTIPQQRTRKARN